MSSKKQMDHLFMFYGEECRFTKRSLAEVACLEKRLGGNLNKLETWHNEKNANKFKEVDVEGCDGVPFFYNSKNQKHLCGYATCDELVEWAKED